jgi:hypothetical protein
MDGSFEINYASNPNGTLVDDRFAEFAARPFGVVMSTLQQAIPQNQLCRQCHHLDAHSRSERTVSGDRHLPRFLRGDVVCKPNSGSRTQRAGSNSTSARPRCRSRLNHQPTLAPSATSARTARRSRTITTLDKFTLLAIRPAGGGAAFMTMLTGSSGVKG